MAFLADQGIETLFDMAEVCDLSTSSLEHSTNHARAVFFTVSVEDPPDCTPLLGLILTIRTFDTPHASFSHTTSSTVPSSAYGLPRRNGSTGPHMYIPGREPDPARLTTKNRHFNPKTLKSALVRSLRTQRMTEANIVDKDRAGSARGWRVGIANTQIHLLHHAHVYAG
jgi:hypothetical protein